MVFICTQLFFIFFQIYKQTRLITLSYQKQKHEKFKFDLLEKKQHLKQLLHATHNYTAIKEFALKHTMQKIQLSQIKTLDHEQPA
jgi:hypothetical protein